MHSDADLQRKLGSIEELLQKVESTADPSLRSTVQELMEVVMNLHGAGLERMVEFVRDSGVSGQSILDKLCRDELVGGLLVLYGIHPLTLETRVGLALEKARSRLRRYDADVELVSAEQGAVRLRLHVKSQSCRGTAQALKDLVEEAFYQEAPDLSSLTIAGAEDKSGFVPLEQLVLRNPVSAPLVLNGSSKGGL